MLVIVNEKRDRLDSVKCNVIVSEKEERGPRVETNREYLTQEATMNGWKILMSSSSLMNWRSRFI